MPIKSLSVQGLGHRGHLDSSIISRLERLISSDQACKCEHIMHTVQAMCFLKEFSHRPQAQVMSVKMRNSFAFYLIEFYLSLLFYYCQQFVMLSPYFCPNFLRHL